MSARTARQHLSSARTYLLLAKAELGDMEGTPALLQSVRVDVARALSDTIAAYDDLGLLA